MGVPGAAWFDWTDDAVTQLKAMWADGLSCSRIAYRLGTLSRSAVIGKANRLGLERRGRAPARIKPRAERRTPFRPKPSSDRTARDAARAARQRELDGIADALADLPADQSPDAVRFLDRDGDICRWPLNEVFPIAEHMVCGAVCGAEESYCSRHYRISTQPYRPRISDAERELRAAIKNHEHARAIGGR